MDGGWVGLAGIQPLNIYHLSRAYGIGHIRLAPPTAAQLADPTLNTSAVFLAPA